MILSAAGLVCAAAAAIVALVALRRTMRRLARTRALIDRIFDRKRLADIATRLELADVELARLMDRARCALDDIRRSSEELKLRKAVFAVRTAVMSVRLLLSGR